MAEVYNVKDVRSLHGNIAERGLITGTSAEALKYNQLVYRNADGKFQGVATNGTTLYGICKTACSAADVSITVMPIFVGDQLLLPFDGTYALTNVGVYAEVTVTSGEPTVNLDETTNDLFKLEEMVSNATGNYWAWFSVAHTANQHLIEG